MSSDDLPPIGAYALIGDGRTAALVSDGGSIDWMCVPRFDDEPVFSRLVAGGRGGRFSLSPRTGRRRHRRYRDGSAVLETTWEADGSETVVTDAMVIDVSDRLLPRSLLVRSVEVRGRPVTIDVLFDPRLGLPGRVPGSVRRLGGGDGGVLCIWGALALTLRASVPEALHPGRPHAFELAPGDRVTFALSISHREPAVLTDPDEAASLVERTDAWWRSWSGEIAFEGPFRDPVVRSLVTLRLLTYTPSGAPVAAPTTSLPEVIGHDSNWDYRFSWPRDASIGVEGFAGTGKLDEAHSFVHWVLHASRLSRPRLDVLYTLDGKATPDEREVDGVPGYRGSLPVRVGNAASDQHQLDVYGWVLDAFCRLDRRRRVHGETWRAGADLADFVAEHWRDADAGIWEVRGEPRQNVHSKLMAGVALERALEMGRRRRVGARRVRVWERARSEIAESIRTRGIDDRGALVGAFDDRARDASVLAPLPDLEPRDPGLLERTIEAVRSDLSAGGALLFRRPPDDGSRSEGAFVACSFWLAQALARSGRHEEAGRIVAEVAAAANDVGLLAEEIDPSTGELLGNFPQALSHSTLVQAALSIGDGAGGAAGGG